MNADAFALSLFDGMRVSERRVCAPLSQHRSTQRKSPRGLENEEALTDDFIELTRQSGGYSKIAALLRDAGGLVNDKRVYPSTSSG